MSKDMGAVLLQGVRETELDGVKGMETADDVALQEVPQVLIRTSFDITSPAQANTVISTVCSMAKMNGVWTEGACIAGLYVEEDVFRSRGKLLASDYTFCELVEMGSLVLLDQSGELDGVLPAEAIAENRHGYPVCIGELAGKAGKLYEDLMFATISGNFVTSLCLMAREVVKRSFGQRLTTERLFDLSGNADVFRYTFGRASIPQGPDYIRLYEKVPSTLGKMLLNSMMVDEESGELVQCPIVGFNDASRELDDITKLWKAALGGLELESTRKAVADALAADEVSIPEDADEPFHLSSEQFFRFIDEAGRQANIEALMSACFDGGVPADDLCAALDRTQAGIDRVEVLEGLISQLL